MQPAERPLRLEDHGDVLEYLVDALVVRSLRAAFRRVCWVGEPPALPPGVPVVLYANHHSFYDGYLTGFLIRRVLRRPFVTWMAEWDRFPLFAAVGVQPFPPDDPARRAATLRRTVRRFRERPRTILAYFPEGRLHRPEEGLLPFDTPFLHRLDRLLPDKLWWPVAIHLTWWGEAQPTALLGGGTPHPRVTGDEAARLQDTLAAVRAASPGETTPLLEGRRSTHEIWNLSLLRPFFARYL